MQCKQTSFRRPPAMPRLAQPLLPASVSSGCPWEWGMGMSTVGMGHGVPKGSLGKVPGVRGSCEGLQGHPWQSQEHPALGTAVDMATLSLVCCGFAGVPQELCSFWVSFEGL